ncbi:MAG TPA: S-layer homology domain-containing protein [Chloroflexia bacterium]|nr:S-layer homology domain-containing protein [Chloroflexia bacterium]
MSNRLFGSLVIAGVLGLSLLAASVLLAGGSTLAQGQNQGGQGQSVIAAQGEGSGSNNRVIQTHAPSAKSKGVADGVWATVAPLPSATLSPTPGTFPLKLKRGGAAAYPPNGKVYLMGGRHGVDGEDTTLTNIYEYTPGDPGRWLLKGAQIDPGLVGNRYTANMAVAVLTDTGGVRIYTVGGSSIDSVPTDRVRVYDPVADSIATLDSDPWPASPVRIPGGWAVYDNKLYIFGGFSRLGDGAVYDDTWRFDPMAEAGSRWTQLDTADLGQARGYVAGATLDGYIYAIGGDTWDGSTLVPQKTVERMDPSLAAPVWVEMSSLPTTRGDLGAWAYDSSSPYEIAGQIAVVGGGYPVPDNIGYIYTASSDSWAPFPEMVHATRNYGYAQLNGYLYAIGGYDFENNLPDGANFVQRYDATNNSVPTPTPCAISFTDVPSDSPFYAWIRCVACRGIISGYSDGTFQPGNDITRGQIAKMVSNAAGINDDPGLQIYQDVPEDSPFYAWINRLSMRGHMGGYPCGLVPEEPCEPPDNRPYFRPNASATRGQLSKIVSETVGIGGDPEGLFYSDVPQDHPFYEWIMRLTGIGVMSGYPCGGEVEPCDEESRPYFRPFNNITRGQASKIVANTFYPNCQTPAR